MGLAVVMISFVVVVVGEFVFKIGELPRSKNFNVVQATNLSFINGVMTFFVGMVLGAVMWKTRSYK